MICCKQLAKALGNQNIEDMPLPRRYMALLHAALCPMCGPYHRDVIAMQKNAHTYRNLEEAPGAEMPEEAKARLAQIIAAEHPFDGQQADSL